MSLYIRMIRSHPLSVPVSTFVVDSMHTYRWTSPLYPFKLEYDEEIIIMEMKNDRKL